MKKYANALPSMEFSPICIEVVPMDPNTLKFLEAICKMISVQIRRQQGTKADIPAVKEPAGLLSESNFRPDGYTLVPWSQGCCLSWDVTFPHTLAERYINYTAMEYGSAAVKAADFKNTKYKDLNDNTRVFVPICVKTFGPVDKQTQLFF
ncbi:hypothetical protein HELRODRAFT_178788 [Helobdella robusta]|uniref:Uncharacterized protein n=1 Tax=Helobdella robusta TaxID=6412 RepID=T1FDQ9_HELRO|nr:hypothetical protein HELRODRAFT_178788 [Helobdella robusta]ESN95872.1 hypothetical protein HELRODRAFT_178788 [Helobdella robusta]